jgi:protein O-mannosyl-transferase
MTSQKRLPERRVALLVFLLCLLVTLLAYRPALSAGFIWDDDAHVTRNPTLRSAEGLWRIWTEPRVLPQYYPLVHTSFWAEFHLWQLDPRGYHLVNVLLHAANAWLLWRVLLVLEVPGAFLAASLFALHPVQAESVAWITERKNVLSTFFYLIALLAYWRFRGAEPMSPSRSNWRAYAISLGCFLFALFSKTVACSLPAALLLLRWWKGSRLELRDWLYTAPMFGLGLALAANTTMLERYQVGARGDEWAWTPVERLLIAGRASWFYVSKLAWPSNLTFIYPQWAIDASAWWQYLFPLGALAVLLIAWHVRLVAGRGPLTCLLFFGGTLVPALGFVNVYPMRYTFVADHFQYVACIGLLTAAAAVASTAIGRLPRGLQWMGWAGCGTLVMVLAALTYQQSRIYKSSITLWEDTLAKNSGAWMAHGNLATVYARQGDATRAAPHLAKVVEHYADVAKRRPSSAQAHHNLGAAFLRQGSSRDALRQFEVAVKLDPNDFASRSYLGGLLSQSGMVEEGIGQLREALRVNPKHQAAHFSLGNVLFQQGRTAEAEAHYREAIALNPDDGQAHSNLGLLLTEDGRKAEAARHFLKAIHLTPDEPVVIENLALLRESEGRYAEAWDLYKRIARLNPGSAEVHQRISDLEQRIRK